MVTCRPLFLGAVSHGSLPHESNPCYNPPSSYWRKGSHGCCPFLSTATTAAINLWGVKTTTRRSNSFQTNSELPKALHALHSSILSLFTAWSISMSLIIVSLELHLLHHCYSHILHQYKNQHPDEWTEQIPTVNYLQVLDQSGYILNFDSLCQKPKHQVGSWVSSDLLIKFAGHLDVH